MNKEDIIKELVDKKAEENNTIDLDAYASGLSKMYDIVKDESITVHRQELLQFIRDMNEDVEDWHGLSKRIASFLGLL